MKKQNKGEFIEFKDEEEINENPKINLDNLKEDDKTPPSSKNKIKEESDNENPKCELTIDIEDNK